MLLYLCSSNFLSRYIHRHHHVILTTINNQIFAGLSSDKFTCISETNKLRVYNSLALGVSALFLIVLAFVPYNSGWPGMIALIAATAAFGFNGGGFNKCSTLVARQYSEFVLGVVQVHFQLYRV